jgi:hypothetical protein
VVSRPVRRAWPPPETRRSGASAGYVAAGAEALAADARSPRRSGSPPDRPADAVVGVVACGANATLRDLT